MTYCLEGSCSIQLSYRTIAGLTGVEPAPNSVTGRHLNRLTSVPFAGDASILVEQPPIGLYQLIHPLYDYCLTPFEL